MVRTEQSAENPSRRMLGVVVSCWLSEAPGASCRAGYWSSVDTRAKS